MMLFKNLNTKTKIFLSWIGLLLPLGFYWLNRSEVWPFTGWSTTLYIIFLVFAIKSFNFIEEDVGGKAKSLMYIIYGPILTINGLIYLTLRYFESFSVGNNWYQDVFFIFLLIFGVCMIYEKISAESPERETNKKEVVK